MPKHKPSHSFPLLLLLWFLLLGFFFFFFFFLLFSTRPRLRLMAATRHNTQQVPGPFGQRRGPLTHIPHRLSFYLSLAFSSILFGFFFFFFFFFVFFFFTGRSHGGRQRQTPLPYRVLFFFLNKTKNQKKNKQPKGNRNRFGRETTKTTTTESISFLCAGDRCCQLTCVCRCVREDGGDPRRCFSFYGSKPSMLMSLVNQPSARKKARHFFFFFFYTEQVRRRRTRSSDPACGISNAARKTKRRQRRRRTCAQWRSRTATDEKVAAPRRPTHTTGRPPNVPRPAERLEPASGRGHGRP